MKSVVLGLLMLTMLSVVAAQSDLEEDPDRLARFQREAQVLASINHPNIAAIMA